MSATSLINEALLSEMDREMTNTRHILERMPEERFGWKPHEKSMTLGRLATHVADLVGFGATVLERDGFSRPAGTDPSTAGSRVRPARPPPHAWRRAARFTSLTTLHAELTRLDRLDSGGA